MLMALFYIVREKRRRLLQVDQMRSSSNNSPRTQQNFYLESMALQADKEQNKVTQYKLHPWKACEIMNAQCSTSLYHLIPSLHTKDSVSGCKLHHLCLVSVLFRHSCGLLKEIILMPTRYQLSICTQSPGWTSYLHVHFHPAFQNCKKIPTYKSHNTFWYPPR